MALTHIAHSTKIPASRRHRAKHLAQVARDRRMAEKEQERFGRRHEDLIDCVGHAGRACEDVARAKIKCASGSQAEVYATVGVSP
jgi:hypothetical protein